MASEQSYGLRYYAPGLGRWINRDPIGELGGMNLYLLGRNDAIRGMDPLGRLDYWDLLDGLLELKAAWERMQDALTKAGQCGQTLLDVWKMFGSFENDKYAHCLASCKISKDCTVYQAVALGAMKEWRDLLMGWLEKGIDPLIPKEWEDWLHDNVQGGTPTESLLDFLANIGGYTCRDSS